MINSDFEKPIVGESVLYDALTIYVVSSYLVSSF